MRVSKGRIAALVAASMIAAPAAAADQFDLICKSRHSEVRYRLDLVKGEWCQGDCRATVKIAQSTAGLLTLADDRPLSRSDVDRHIIINRSTGEWYSSLAIGREVGSEVKGKCEPAAFSGFPSAKF